MLSLTIQDYSLLFSLIRHNAFDVRSGVQLGVRLSSFNRLLFACDEIDEGAFGKSTPRLPTNL
jgi:hypothetical protein